VKSRMYLYIAALLYRGLVAGKHIQRNLPLNQKKGWQIFYCYQE